jgi:tetratricopeptide (TPR) repeat protein
LHGAGRRDEAIEYARDALARTPNAWYLQKALGEFLAESPDLDLALDALNELIEQHPETSWFRYWRGRVNSDLGKYEEALKDVSKSLEFIPEDREVRPFIEGRAMIHLANGNQVSAQADFAKANKLRPNKE